jgi:ribosome biogenesis GTPase
MNDTPAKLKEIGFGEWFLEAVPPEHLEQFNLARVVAVHKNRYTLSNGEVESQAELLGKIIYSASSPLDYPAVGDWVLASFFDENTLSIIHQILPRKTLLKRKTPGKKIDFQLIGANIDVAFIVQSLNENFNLRRLERYLVMVSDNDIRPVVLLSKSDLLPMADTKSRIEDIHKIMPRLKVIPFSNEDESGLDSAKEIMEPGLTYCLLGSSGVGKTTLINNLIGESVFKTKTVSKKESKGRHATTHRQLITLESGPMIVDTPGMRELGNLSTETGLSETFSEIMIIAENCRFNDCTHVGEKGCAVLEAVEKGQLPDERYQNYIKMTKESTYHEMSYLEKRRKDKQFGKFCKNVMKSKKKNRNST